MVVLLQDHHASLVIMNKQTHANFVQARASSAQDHLLASPAWKDTFQVEVLARHFAVTINVMITKSVTMAILSLEMGALILASLKKDSFAHLITLHLIM